MMQPRSRIGLDLGVVAALLFCVYVWVSLVLLVLPLL